MSIILRYVSGKSLRLEILNKTAFTVLCNLFVHIAIQTNSTNSGHLTALKKNSGESIEENNKLQSAVTH